jgi:hypothetical protein
MTIDIGINLLKDVFINTTFAGSFWIYHIMILFGCMVMITRKANDWALVALPLIVGLDSLGMNYNFIFYITSAIAFTLNTLSLKMVTAGLSGAMGGIGKMVGKGTDWTLARTTDAGIIKRQESLALKRMEKREMADKISSIKNKLKSESESMNKGIEILPKDARKIKKRNINKSLENIEKGFWEKEAKKKKINKKEESFKMQQDRMFDLQKFKVLAQTRGYKYDVDDINRLNILERELEKKRKKRERESNQLKTKY